MFWTFDPIYKTTVWGGDRLLTYKAGSQSNHPDAGDAGHIGESWELSALPGDESIVTNGPEQGLTLSELVRHHGHKLLGKHVHEKCGERFPLLIKFIHTAANLSVQVHPSDRVARSMGIPSGKNEMWVIVEAQPGAFLYNGFNRPISPEEIAPLAANSDILKTLRRIEVKPGDAFHIPAGRIHAIGAGILLAEIQQSSTDTFRIYDYERLGLDGKPRQLHLDKAKLALNCEDMDGGQLSKSIDGNPLLESNEFTVHNLTLTSTLVRHPSEHDSFAIYMVLHGNVTLSSSDGSLTLAQGSTALVSANTETISLTPHNDSGPASLLEIYC